MSCAPDEVLVAEARRRLSGTPASLIRHSLRMAAPADALAQRDGLVADRAGVFCACSNWEGDEQGIQRQWDGGPARSART